MQFYTLALACETCGETMRNRVVVTDAGAEEEPVIFIDMAVSQTVFECYGCGSSTFLGDLEDIIEHEPGVEHLEDEDE